MIKTPSFGGFNTSTGPKMGAGFTVGFVLRQHSKAQPGDVLIDSRVSSSGTYEKTVLFHF